MLLIILNEDVSANVFFDNLSIKLLNNTYMLFCRRIIKRVPSRKFYDLILQIRLSFMLNNPTITIFGSLYITKIELKNMSVIQHSDDHRIIDGCCFPCLFSYNDITIPYFSFHGKYIVLYFGIAYILYNNPSINAVPFTFLT